MVEFARQMRLTVREIGQAHVGHVDQMNGSELFGESCAHRAHLFAGAIG